MVMTTTDAPANEVVLTKEPVDDLSTSNFNIKSRRKTLSKERIWARLKETAVIPAKTEKMVIIGLEQPVKSAFTGATDTLIAEGRHDILIGKSISAFTPNESSAIIRICNISDNPVTLKAGRRMTKIIETEIAEEKVKKHASFKEIMDEIKIGACSRPMKNQIEELLFNYQDIFASTDGPISRTDKMEYEIHTTTEVPIAQQKYKTPYFLRGEMKRIIEKNIEQGLMEPCSSPWAAPLLLVRKQNGKWRLVCDYRKLNNVTISDNYPLPEIGDLVNELAESTVFSTTDLRSGFHQIPCTENAKEKLAIVTEDGQFTWKVMPMGGKNCPSVFQRLMDRVFRSMTPNQLVIYLDDLCIHSKTEEEHVKKLESTFKILRESRLQIQASKTNLNMKKVLFCGYEISNGKKRANPAKVEDGGHFTQNINPNSLTILQDGRVEPAIQTVKKGETIQFERQGYFCLDSEEHSGKYLIFNRTVPLRDPWKKIQKKVDNNFG